MDNKQPDPASVYIETATTFGTKELEEAVRNKVLGIVSAGMPALVPLIVGDKYFKWALQQWLTSTEGKQALGEALAQYFERTKTGGYL